MHENHVVSDRAMRFFVFRMQGAGLLAIKKPLTVMSGLSLRCFAFQSGIGVELDALGEFVHLFGGRMLVDLVFDFAFES